VQTDLYETSDTITIKFYKEYLNVTEGSTDENDLYLDIKKKVMDSKFLKTNRRGTFNCIETDGKNVSVINTRSDTIIIEIETTTELEKVQQVFLTKLFKRLITRLKNHLEHGFTTYQDIVVDDKWKQSPEDLTNKTLVGIDPGIRTVFTCYFEIPLNDINNNDTNISDIKYPNNAIKTHFEENNRNAGKCASRLQEIYYKVNKFLSYPETRQKCRDYEGMKRELAPQMESLKSTLTYERNNKPVPSRRRRK
jgi:hypothetical protein